MTRNHTFNYTQITPRTLAAAHASVAAAARVLKCNLIKVTQPVMAFASNGNTAR